MHKDVHVQYLSSAFQKIFLAAEVLAEAIRSNRTIEGITSFNKEPKVSQYADDTTLFIKPNETSIRNCMCKKSYALR